MTYSFWTIGTEFTDTVTLGPGLTISKQSIGVAAQSQGFGSEDGILGFVSLVQTAVPLMTSMNGSIGPVDLTIGTYPSILTL